MSGIDAFLSGHWSTGALIAMIAAITYFCRVGGALVMTRVRVSPAVERGMRALPGAVFSATIAPPILDGGFVALVAVGTGIAVMLASRSEILALAAGLGCLSVLRLFGL